MERTIRELLIILRDSIENKEEIQYGLCLEIDIMYLGKEISLNESMKLTEFIDKNRPHLKFIGYLGWRPRLVKCRVKWLKKQIKSFSYLPNSF